jgi:uncharacterized protein involved in exopolysaccharide biosynthesis
MEEEIDLRPYISGFAKYWWIILGSSLLGGVLAYFFISNQPPTYQASAIVTVLEPTDVFQFDLRVTNASTSNAILKVLPELAKSNQVLKTLTERLEAEGIPTVEKLQDNLAAEGGRDPILLYLRARSENPEDAAEIANLWAEIFVSLGNEVYANRGESNLQFYEDQFASASARLDAANESLVDFQAQNRLALVTNELTSLNLTHAEIISHTQSLRTLRDEIQAARIQQDQLSANPIGQADEFTVLSLQARAFQLQETLPFVFQTTGEVAADTDRRNLIEFLTSLEDMVTEMENASANRLAEIEPQLLSLQHEFERLNAETTRLTVNRDLALETYSLLSRKLDEERIAVQDTNSGFRVASQASVPQSPGATNQVLAALMGAVIGAILSSAGIILYTWWRK